MPFAFVILALLKPSARDKSWLLKDDRADWGPRGNQTREVTVDGRVLELWDPSRPSIQQVGLLEDETQYFTKQLDDAVLFVRASAK